MAVKKQVIPMQHLKPDFSTVLKTNTSPIGEKKTDIGQQLDQLIAQIRNNQITNLDFNQQFWTEVEETKESKCEKTLAGHSSCVICLIQLEDGRIASGGGDNTIKIWNINSGQCEKTLAGHSNYILGLIQLPDGRLASGSWDNTIKLWNVSSGGQCEKTLTGHSDKIMRLILLSDGRIASGSDDRTIKIWDINSGKCEKTLQEHSSDVWGLTQLFDGRIASGSRDKTIKIWNINSGQCEKTLTGHSDAVWSLIQLFDGRIASASYDKTIKIWNISSGQCEKTLTGHSAAIRCLIQLTDGRIATGAYDKTINIWDINSGQCEKTLQGHNDTVTSLIQLSKTIIVSGSDDKIIKVWDIGGKMLIKKMEKITDWQILKVLAELKNNVSVNNISLRGYRLNEQVCNSLVELLKINKGIQLVNLSNAECNGDLGSFLQFVQANKKLFKFDNCKINNYHVNNFPLINHPDFSVYQITYSKLTWGEKLGEGGFGAVYKGTYNNGGVAIKKLHMKIMTAEAKNQFKNEIAAMIKSKHPNIITFFGYCEAPNYCIIMELMMASLSVVLHDSNKNLDWNLRLQIAKDVVAGIFHLHGNKILHRDLKSLNVLLSKDMQAKLSDFGLAIVKTESETETGQKAMGTPAWMAPEILSLHPEYSYKSDIYACGIVFWEISSRKYPYAGVDVGVMKDEVKKGGREEIPKDCPVKFAALIKSCWAQDPKERPTAEVVFKGLNQ
jgi:WD40 repeat protein